MKRFAAFLLLFVALRAHADFTLVYDVVEGDPNNGIKCEYTFT